MVSRVRSIEAINKTVDASIDLSTKAVKEYKMFYVAKDIMQLIVISNLKSVCWCSKEYFQSTILHRLYGMSRYCSCFIYICIYYTHYLCFITKDFF